MRPPSPSTAKSNGFCSCTCTCAGAGPRPRPRPPPRGMEISELEFVQIIIILLVMTFMIVVIICLLNQYRLSALAFLSRLSHAPGQQASQQDATIWQNTMLTPQRSGEVMCGRLSSSLAPVTLPQQLQQQQQVCRFQPTYPYLPQDIINLPPIICLSDGEELPPYKGPCRLQLRPPDQQLELIRASVRAPPNRTIFDSELIDVYMERRRGEGGSSGLERPPPSYSEVMGGYAASMGRYSNNAPPVETRAEPDGSQTDAAPPESTSTSSDCDGKS